MPVETFDPEGEQRYERQAPTRLTPEQKAAAYAASPQGMQEQQWQESQDMFAPFIGMGEQGLAGMGSLMSGEYTPSSEMQYQQGLGEMALSNAYGAGGMGRSSAAQTGFGNMYADLLGEDVQRQYGDMYSMMGVGRGAVGQIGQAGNAYQQNMGNIYGQQGAANAATAMAKGQSAANMWNTAGSALGGATQYMMQNPGMFSGGGSNPYMSTSNPMGLTPGQGM